MGAADKLKEISQETHEVQELLDCALDEIITDRYSGKTFRIVVILNTLRDKLCAIDGLQQSLLSELTEKENALDGETNTIQGHETKTIDKV